MDFLLRERNCRLPTQLFFRCSFFFLENGQIPDTLITDESQAGRPAPPEKSQNQGIHDCRKTNFGELSTGSLN